MPQQTITSSPNISVLASKLIVDLCTGKFYVDLTQSQFIGPGGAAAILGAKIKITNPFGVPIKDFSTGYDIASPFTDVYNFDIPQQSGNYNYGLYIIEVQITDANGTLYSVIGNVSPCAPNTQDSTDKYGHIMAQILGDCARGLVTVMMDQPPVYKSLFFESKVQSVVVTYPSGGPGPLTSIQNAFSVALIEGVYKVEGTTCVTYNAGDNIYYKVNYKIKCQKNILCRVDLCCVFDKLVELRGELSDNCNATRTKEISDIILDALSLVTAIQLGVDCGQDVSDQIDELEKLLKCQCSCSSTEGTPITPATPSTNISITGCNVGQSEVGQTTVYNIDNFEFVVGVNPDTNFITVSSPTLLNCVKTQQITFNLAAHYAAMKAIINTTPEYDFWAAVVNQTLSTIPGPLLACLGINDATWNAKSFRNKFIAVIEKLCACCGSTSCGAAISGLTQENSGGGTLFSWTPNAEVRFVDIFIDGVYQTTLLVGNNSYFVPNTAGTHTYSIIAKCADGIIGLSESGTITNAPCITILAPALSLSSVTDAACPYDLTTLASSPSGAYEIRWYNANNTNSANFIVDPTAVVSGEYYAFLVQKASGCFSTGSHFHLACHVTGNCTEPLSMLVVESGVSNNVITFNSAATPPPTYLVKRRMASDPDITGSYTTIGAPVFDAGTSRWGITDSGATANTLYIYKAESQCGDGSRPNTQYTFANLTCPVLTLTPAPTTIGYSFVNVGGQVDKYLVKLYDSTGFTLIHTDTVLPAFSTPIAGSFTGLTAGTSYRVVVTVFIGSYSKTCTRSFVSTSAPVGLAAILSRDGGTGILTLAVSGGSAPYSWVLDCVTAGSCSTYAFTPSASGTLPDSDTLAMADPNAAEFSGSTYAFKATVTDNLGTVVDSNTVNYNACLDPETQIKLPAGDTRILDEIKNGDLLWSRNGQRNMVVSKTEHTVDAIYIINEDLIKASEWHLHPIHGSGVLVQSHDLKVGQMLEDANGLPVEIKSIVVERGSFRVINIATETKVYVANGILTHNKSACV